MIGKILRKVRPLAVFGFVMWLGFQVLDDVHDTGKRVVGDLLFLVAAMALVVLVEHIWGDLWKGDAMDREGDDAIVDRIARDRRKETHNDRR
jgi:hypothetical protein